MKCDKCGKKITSKYWIRTKGYPNPSYAGFSKLCYECGLEVKKHRNAYDWTLKKLKRKTSKVTEERLKEAYRNFAESISPEEDKIKDWIGRSSNGSPKH